MSARAVTLRALVVEDLARTAERCQRHAAAMLLRRFPEDSTALNTVASDLRTANTPAARVAGAAAGHLADGNVRRAAGYLAEFCGLSLEEWTAETSTEHGVRYAAPEAV